MSLRAPWPVYVASAGAVLGAVATVVLLASVPFSAPATILFVALWQAMGATTAAAVVLAGTLLEAALRRSLAIERTRAPRAIVATVAGAMAIVLALVVALAIDAEVDERRHLHRRDQRHAELRRRRRRPRHRRERVVIGHRDHLHAELGAEVHVVLGLGAPVGQAGVTVQIGGDQLGHGGVPCQRSKW